MTTRGLKSKKITMHAATKSPELFKCIIAYVGVYDLTSMDLRGLRWSELGGVY